MTIDELNLNPNPRRAAEAIQRLHPDIVFTSGRRDLHAQARAMARNVFRDPLFMEVTYKPGRAKMLLEHWLREHPDATEQDMVEGFTVVLGGMEQLALAQLSRHFSGDAWDAAYPKLDDGNDDDAEAAAIKQDLMALSPDFGVEKVLLKEGSIKVIHAQFTPSAMV